MNTLKGKEKLNSLSVFFPMYNEEKNVEPVVEQCMKVFPSVAKKFEIILVNDGSIDKTKQEGQRMSKKYKQVRVADQPNMGYGGAVKRGFKEARYEWVFFSDGDLQFDLSEIHKFIKHTKDNDLVIGYRNQRAEGLKRKTIADMLKIWNRMLLGFPVFIKDIDCAFKLIKKDVIENVGELQTDGAMLTTEFLLKAHKLGYNLEQVGVNHYKRQWGSQTGSNVGVIGKAVKETFVLRKIFADYKLNKVTKKVKVAQPVVVAR